MSLGNILDGAIGRLIREQGVQYYSRCMNWCCGHSQVFKITRLWYRPVRPLVILLLVMVPSLDLAWNDSTLDESQGAYCQLHANPGVSLQPVSPVMVLSAERFLPFQPLDRFPLIGSCIFIPPPRYDTPAL